MRISTLLVAPLALAGTAVAVTGSVGASAATKHHSVTAKHSWPHHVTHSVHGERCFHHVPRVGRPYYNCWPATAARTAAALRAAPVGTAQPLGDPGTWKLVFDSEFNGTSLNQSKWTPYWFSNGSTSNGTTMLSSNVSESGGSLNLNLSNGSGGLVSTNGKFSYTYGFAEARIYLPASGSQVANWPAFWTDGQSWPTDGEQDIMEGLGGQACYHFHSNAGGPGSCASGNYSGWHTFGADWQPGSVTYYYDGQKVGTITQGITSSPMYLILENSGGSYGGPKVLPSTMKVDYVRVWQH